jgi:hypothetical protein
MVAICLSSRRLLIANSVLDISECDKSRACSQVPTGWHMRCQSVALPFCRTQSKHSRKTQCTGGAAPPQDGSKVLSKFGQMRLGVPLLRGGEKLEP